MRLPGIKTLALLLVLALLGALAHQAVQSARLKTENARLAEQLIEIRKEESSLTDQMTSLRERQEALRETAAAIPKTTQEITRLKAKLATNSAVATPLPISRDEVTAQIRQLLEEKRAREEAEWKQKSLVAQTFRDFLKSNRGIWPTNLAEMLSSAAGAQSPELATAVKALQEDYDLMPPNRVFPNAASEGTLFLRSKQVREEQINDRTAYVREFLSLDGSAFSIAADSKEGLAAAEQSITEKPASAPSEAGPASPAGDGSGTR